MSDVEIKFERENLDGIVAVGTYLIDAMKRFGVRPEENCIIPENVHYCAVQITKGLDKLSIPTADEKAYFEVHGQQKNERLACQVVVEKAGEVMVMTKEKKEEAKPEEQNQSDEYRKAFEEMPLEKKIANLMRLEAIALGETVSFIANSPFMVFDKIGDVMAEFGFKLEKNAKAAARPKEHTEAKAKKKPESEGEERNESSQGNESTASSETK
jgi:ferredoxin